MTIEKLTELFAPEKIDKLVGSIKECESDFDFEAAAKQYDVSKHDIFDPIKRPDNYIKKVVKNSEGEEIKDQYGNTALTIEKIVPVTRIGMPLQETIVSTAVAFLCGNPIKLDATAATEDEKGYIELLQKIYADNKLEYRNATIAELLFSETEVAELWYNPKVEDGNNYWEGYNMKTPNYPRMKILARSLGDTLYPVYDLYGDMIAFGRGWIEVADEGKKIEHIEIYTATKFYYISNRTGKWDYDKAPENNAVGKIPIIYRRQKQTEWQPVQPTISRLETTVSNHPDTNDYNGSPMLFFSGRLVEMPDKEDTGKLIVGETGSKAEYVTWQQAPESIRMEIENEYKWIFNLTSTPDLSFDSMKGLGSAPSGYAMELMFLSAHLKAKKKAQQGYGEAEQRRINYLRAWLKAFDIRQAKFDKIAIKPKFDIFMPKNNAEYIDMLNSAVSGGIMSKKTAVRLNPIIEDADTELELIKAEAPSPDQQLNQLMNQ